MENRRNNLLILYRHFSIKMMTHDVPKIWTEMFFLTIVLVFTQNVIPTLHATYNIQIEMHIDSFKISLNNIMLCCVDRYWSRWILCKYINLFVIWGWFMSERFCYLSSWTCSEKINVGKNGKSKVMRWKWRYTK